MFSLHITAHLNVKYKIYINAKGNKTSLRVQYIKKTENIKLQWQYT